jgi:hypothetical protein
VVDPIRNAFLQRKPVEASDIQSMRSRPAIVAVADIRDNPFLARDFEKICY